MLRSILNDTNEGYDLDTWLDYDALYAGGKKFFERIGRFLLANPEEPMPVYNRRKKEANYRCYLGGIIDFFSAYLISSPIVVRATRAGKVVDPDNFYGEFKEDCDNKDNDIHVFIKGRVAEAMVKRWSWWLVEAPVPPGNGGPESRAEWERLGLDKLHVRTLKTEQVLDWELDDDGQMVWATVYSVSKVRPTPFMKRDTVVERWDVYDAETVTRFELRYRVGQKPAGDPDVPMVSKRAHGFSRVPIVCLDVEDALWVANRAASPQKENFRLTTALGWQIRRTCYSMPVFNLEDKDSPPLMGAGYYFVLGLQEKMAWSSPETGPIQQIRDTIKDEKDEIFRIVHQMALGVDNNAAAIGRSGKSKEVDSQAVRVVLSALGQLAREALERTYSLLSEGRGDDYDWSIEGLDTFDNVNLDDLVAAALGIMSMNIPSPTLHRELMTQVGLAAVPDAEQKVKDNIRAEVEKNVTDESVLKPPEIPPDVDDNDGGTPDDGAVGATPAEPAQKSEPAPKTPKAKPTKPAQAVTLKIQAHAK